MNMPTMNELCSKMILELSEIRAERVCVVDLMNETWPSNMGGAEAQLSDMMTLAAQEGITDVIPSLATIGRMRRRQSKGPSEELRTIIKAAARYALTCRRNEATAKLRERRYEWSN